MTKIIATPHLRNGMFFNRKQEFMEDSEKLLSLVKKEALAQIMASSFPGHFGKKIQKLSS